MTGHIERFGWFCWTCLLGSVLFLAPAAAADMSGEGGYVDPAASFGALDPTETTVGTLSMAPSLAWATPLEDEEMSELRGGFKDFMFGVQFEVLAGQLTVAEGLLNFGGDLGLPAPVLEGFHEAASGSVNSFASNFQSTSGLMQVLNIENATNLVALQTMNVNIYTLLSPTDPTKMQLNSIQNLGN